MAGSAAREFAWALLVATLAVIAVAVALGALGGALGTAIVVVLALAALRFAWLSWLSLTSARAVREVLAEVEPPADQRHSSFPRSQLIVPPLMLWPRGVSHRRGIEFARPGGRPLRLDVYRTPTDVPASEPRPAVVQVHGGGWIAGTRYEQGIPLLNHLAQHGWVGFNVDYRLSPRGDVPRPRRRRQARDRLGPRARRASSASTRSFICITGGSAGGHL